MDWQTKAYAIALLAIVLFPVGVLAGYKIGYYTVMEKINAKKELKKQKKESKKIRKLIGEKSNDD